ncbi:MAG: cytochrome c family protein [Rhodobiaceae bacterium]|nr:cytochrome c family protein [Rhodobiaceae bacterium]
MIKRIAILAATTLLTVAAAHAAGDPAEGEKVFKKCKACHANGAGAKNKVGPELNGVVGRPWGSIEGFKYSEGKDGTLLKIAEGGDKVWDVPTLTAYLAAPKEIIPKGKMAFAGLKKPEDVANVIAYLASFDADGNPVDPVAVIQANGGE